MVPHRIHAYPFELWRGDTPEFYRASLEQFTLAGQHGQGFQYLGERGRVLNVEVVATLYGFGSADANTSAAKYQLQLLQGLPSLGPICIVHQNVNQLLFGYKYKVVDVSGTMKTSVYRLNSGTGGYTASAPCVLTVRMQLVPHRIADVG